jgi:hypothetical protein
LPQKARKRKPRAVVDTSVLVAGISGSREPFVSGRNPSADVLHRWGERNDFVWLITEDILEEYKEVLKRLRVCPNLIGRVINLVRERAEEVFFQTLLAAAKLSPFALPRFTFGTLAKSSMAGRMERPGANSAPGP